MSGQLTPRLVCSSGIHVERRRELPVAGEILVRQGQAVKAGEVLAHAVQPGDLRIVRIAEQLGLTPEEVQRGLKVRSGELVSEGTLLCEHRGMFGWLSLRCFSPGPGTIELISEETGHLCIRAPSQAVELRSYLSGNVTAIEGAKAVSVAATGTLIQGIFGVGGERHGVLSVFETAPDTRLTEKHIPADCKGKILVGGTAPSYEALKALIDGGAQGLLTGAVDDVALQRLLGYELGLALTGDEAIPLTLIVTEGFGALPLGERVTNLLRPLAGSLAAMNGATQVRAGAVRPELIVAGEPGGAPAERAGIRQPTLEVGARIRLIRVPYFGMSAEVVELPSESGKLESGVEARVLRAKLQGSGEEVIVPRANVELLD